MTSDMIDQLFLNENFSNVHLNNAINTNNFNNLQNIIQNNLLNNQVSNFNQSLNKIKLSEYKQKEEAALNIENKNNFLKNKKSFKELVSNLSGMGENIEKYFKLPEKMYCDKMSKKFIIQAKKI